jgi:hypothetical protein
MGRTESAESEGIIRSEEDAEGDGQNFEGFDEELGDGGGAVDEEDGDEAIVYVGRSLQSAGYMVPLGCLRQPPFAGAMRSPSAPTFWVPDNEPLPAPAAMPATITCPHCKDTITPSHPATSCPL